MTQPLPPAFRRTLVAGVAGAGLLLLAGCTIEGANAEDVPTPTTEATPESTSVYADGTYIAEGDYVAPSGVETVSVSLTIADDVVTDVSVTGDAVDHEAIEFQELFARSIAAEVLGKDIAGLSVTRVSGSSLTSAGFNAALEKIRAEAQA